MSLGNGSSSANDVFMSFDDFQSARGSLTQEE